MLTMEKLCHGYLWDTQVDGEKMLLVLIYQKYLDGSMSWEDLVKNAQKTWAEERE